MTTDVKLLPCPFCGRDEHLQVEHLEGTVVHPAYRVSCDNCGASTGYTDTDCRKVWNDRANMEPLLAENERLESRCHALAEALSLLPDEIDMIEHNPDEGLHTFCCGREVKSRGLHGFLITHDDDCWYVRMQAMREQEGGKKGGE